MSYEWAENNIKLDMAKKSVGQNPTEEALKREYIKHGGVIRLASGKNIDNKTENLDELINEPTFADGHIEHHEDSSGTVIQKRVRKPKPADGSQAEDQQGIE